MLALIEASRRLSDACDSLISPLAKQTIAKHITNPLDYARECHEDYLHRYGSLGAKTLMLGMNPGPWGMAQCGVPFGATAMVRELLDIDLPVKQPQNAHPKRPIIGISLQRQEASGTRLWSLLNQHYGTAEQIHEQVFLVNHCPLLLLDEKARNITPDKISGKAVTKLMDVCDQHLRDVVEALGIKRIIGVGKYAEKRSKVAFGGRKDIAISSCWHPSPASPLANRNDGKDWRENVISVLEGF
jgi:single-strand selective monofunctional uracil DNA glycosylase